MTGTKLEQKQETSWPWICAGLALIALILWFLFARGDRASVTVASPGAVADSLVDDAVIDSSLREYTAPR